MCINCALSGESHVANNLTNGLATVGQPSAPVNAIAGTQTWGNGGAGETVINVYFADNMSSDGLVSDAWTAKQIAQFQAALDIWSSVANIKFQRVFNINNADLVEIVAGDDEFVGALGEAGILGYHNGPTTPSSYALGAFNTDYWDDTNGELGGYGFITLIHEIGHALGLAHPHDDGFGSNVMSGVSGPFGDLGTGFLNQGVYSVMSYNDGWYQRNGGMDSNDTYGGSTGLGALDIAAIQHMYGTRNNYNTGNDVYTLATANGAGVGYQAIWDTGGRDTIRYDGASDAVINLTAATLNLSVGGGGYISFSQDGIESGFTIANGVVIEVAIGGSGNDTLTGNNWGNELRGNDGNDLINGEGGNDWIFGDKGADEAYGDDGVDRMWGGNEADTLYGGNGNDIVYGGFHADRLFGQLGNDTLYGDHGFDVLYGGGGWDYLNGGSLRDSLFGQDGNDRLFGDEGDDDLFGGIGGDYLNGGNGKDLLEGEDGDDTLHAGAGDDKAVGGLGDDAVYGQAGNDTVMGSWGNDLVNGGSGDDWIMGHTGNDQLVGGAGSDTFTFFVDSGFDRIIDFNDAVDTISFSINPKVEAFSDLTITSYAGVHTRIDYGDNDVLFLWNVNSGTLDSSDFVF